MVIVVVSFRRRPTRVRACSFSSLGNKKNSIRIQTEEEEDNRSAGKNKIQMRGQTSPSQRTISRFERSQKPGNTRPARFRSPFFAGECEAQKCAARGRVIFVARSSERRWGKNKKQNWLKREEKQNAQLPRLRPGLTVRPTTSFPSWRLELVPTLAGRRLGRYWPPFGGFRPPSFVR